jgi:hypothetical protein
LNKKEIMTVVKVNNYLISRTEAIELMKKYNSNKSLNDLKLNSAIELTIYDKFRRENKTIINEFNRTADSISFKVTRDEKKFSYLEKKSIGKTKTLTTMFVPLDFLNAVVYPSIKEPIEKIWDGMVADAVEEAKDGGLNGVYKLTDSDWFNKDKFGDYQYTLINGEILNKLLKGEIKTLKRLNDLYEDQLIKNNYNKSLFEYTILHYSIKNADNNNYKTYVDSIFIN